VRKRDLAEVERLVAQPLCDVNCRDKEHNTPLHWAAVQGDAALLRALLGRRDLDVNRQTKQKQCARRVPPPKDEARFRPLPPTSLFPPTRGLRCPKLGAALGLIMRLQTPAGASSGQCQAPPPP